MKGIRYFVQSDHFPKTEVTPIHSGKYSYAQESGKIYYRHKPEDKIKFEKTDYFLLLSMEDNECEEVIFTTEIFCSGEWVEYWAGYFKWFNVSEDKDRCFIEVEPLPFDQYKCIDDNGDEEIQGDTGPIITINQTLGEYVTETCTVSNLGFGPGNVPANTPPPDTPSNICIGGELGEANWCLKSWKNVFPDGEFATDVETGIQYPLWEQITIWHRETLPGSCEGLTAIPPDVGLPEEWTLLSGDCDSDQPPIFWRCPGTVIGPYNWGRLLTEAIKQTLKVVCPSLALKSDFFGVNPSGDAPDNIAYQFAEQYLRNITLHQKSNIKRPNASNQALSRSWQFKAEDLFNDLRTMMNLFYIIEGNYFILEHISFFDSVEGLNLSDAPKKARFTFNTGEIYKRERYFSMDRGYFGEFNASPIYNDCGSGEQEFSLSMFTNDASFIENPDNADLISDEGFVLIANDVVDGEYYPISGNSPLKWLNLHEHLHKHGRAYRSGIINGISQDFLSYKRYKKLEKFTAPVCCSDGFNPSDELVTEFGNGTLQSGIEDIVRKTIEFELLI